MNGASGDPGIGAFEMASDPTICDSIRLAMLPGIGPRTMTLLLERFGDATAVLHASAGELAEVSGVGSKLIHTIKSADHFVDMAGTSLWCQQHHAQVLVRNRLGYPSMLDEIPDPPSLLFVQGDLEDDDEFAVALVGTRHATPYGLKQAEHFAFMLAKSGVTIVSGLARGIDAAAHRGAMNAGGRTLAVLGGGLGQIYPSEHQSLAEQIRASGAVISEYGPHAKPRSGMFPQRNRIIAGLSLAVVVVEAPERSGALITARLATEQNREVMAIPGPINSRASRGCNLLIRDGAKLVQCIDDVLEEIGPLQNAVRGCHGQPIRSGVELTLNECERKVLDSIPNSPVAIDQVIRVTGLPAARVISVLTVLEVKRLIGRQGGYARRIGSL